MMVARVMARHGGAQTSLRNVHGVQAALGSKMNPLHNLGLGVAVAVVVAGVHAPHASLQFKSMYAELLSHSPNTAHLAQWGLRSEQTDSFLRLYRSHESAQSAVFSAMELPLSLPKASVSDFTLA